MKMRLGKTTLVVALTIFLVPPNTAGITQTEKQTIKNAIAKVRIPELPAVAADLVVMARKADRPEVAAVAVRAAVHRSKAAAVHIVAAVAKADPEVAGIAVSVALQMTRGDGAAIARAAAAAAPGARRKVALALLSEVTTNGVQNFATQARVGDVAERSRGSYGGVPTGNVTQSREPINAISGGNGFGQFPTEPPRTVPEGCVCPYVKPRSF